MSYFWQPGCNVIAGEKQMQKYVLFLATGLQCDCRRKAKVRTRFVPVLRNET